MKLYSTQGSDHLYSFREATLVGLAPDGGLFMPVSLPIFKPSYFDEIHKKTFQEICFDVTQSLLKDEIPDSEIERIVIDAFNFKVPLIQLDEDITVMELFHGPSLAFKDFGSRFMSRILSFFNRNEDRELIVIVATSGDTGGAVAAGFHLVPGIKVVILYPDGGVSPIQEKQLTTFGDNIIAVAVKGTFDDCQALAKKALNDKALRKELYLSSANSINIARLLPQSFYYFEIFRQSQPKSSLTAVSIPSGNFGNLFAGLLAKKMGAPIHKILAATNANDVVPLYLRTGKFIPKPSVPTLANAMDVGNPSNFSRILSLYGSTWNKLKRDITGYSFNDKEIVRFIETVSNRYDYILDPHGAIGMLALTSFLQHNSPYRGVFLETAHPAKFLNVYDETKRQRIKFPPSLAALQSKETHSINLSNQFELLRSLLLDVI